jgi:hypothetical protein
VAVENHGDTADDGTANMVFSQKIGYRSRGFQDRSAMFQHEKSLSLQVHSR